MLQSYIWDLTKTLFLYGTAEKQKIAVMAFSSKKTVSIEWHFICQKTLHFKFCYKIEHWKPTGNFGNILTFDKESKNIYCHISAGSLIKNNIWL